MNNEISQTAIAKIAERFPEFKVVIKAFIENHFEFPEKFDELISSFISPISLSEFLEKKDNSQIAAKSWKNFLDNQLQKKEQDSDLVAQIILLKIFLNRFGRFELRNALNFAFKEISSLTGRSMQVTGSFFEMKRRLAGKLYDLGRRGESDKLSKNLLLECIENFSFLIEKDQFADDFRMKTYRGMRGTSYLLLARFLENPLDAYEKAVEDLEISNKLGDNSLSHFHYRIEAYFHCHDLSTDKFNSKLENSKSSEEYLEKINFVLNEVDREKLHSRRISFYKGQHAFRKGILESANNPIKAITSFTKAIDNFFKCFEADDPSLNDNTVFANRGQAYFRLYTTTRRNSGEEKFELLENAIDDFLQKDERGNIAGESGITLPSALFFRASQLEKGDEQNKSLIDTKLALEFLEYPKDDEQENLRKRLLKLLWKNEIGLGKKENDVQRVAKATENILTASDNLDYPILHLTQAASFFSFKLRYEESQHWLLRISEYIEKYVETEKEELKNFQFAASALGFIYAILAKNSREQYERGTKFGADFENFIIKTYLKSHKWNTAAIECNPSNSSPQTFIDAGEASLRLARAYQAFDSIDEENSLDKAVGFLTDAYKYYSKIISKIKDSTSKFENLAEDVPYSKLGEVCYRLYTLRRRQPEFAEEAIFNFKTSRELGNQSAAVVGLTGDVYYRRGKFDNNIKDLKLALDYKRKARELGSKGRENPSVCSATSLQLWELTNDINYLTDAIIFACKSISADPQWSWSYFQLAEISRLDINSIRLATKELFSDWSIKDIISKLRSGKTNTLYREAINCALKSKEFEPKSFHSRQTVYAFDDPHKLLNKNFIFKHTEKENAEREVTIIKNFRSFLAENKSPNYFKLTEPLDIIPDSLINDKDRRKNPVVYVMRRSSGIRLGESVINWLNGGEYPNETFSKTVQFLAYYHIWGVQFNSSQKPFRIVLANEIRKMVDFWKSANFANEVCEKVNYYLTKIVPGELPLFLKKDAHPENWLVSYKGNIVMIDLEAATELPIFYEIVQLVDDYPLFEANEVGWKNRIEICNVYLNTLNNLGYEISFSENEISDVYTSFLLFRVAFSIARFRRSEKKFKDEFSSASLEMIDVREKHFLSILQFIFSNTRNIEMKNFAEYMLNQIKNKPINWSKCN